MVLSSFIIHSGISKFIGKLLQPVIQFLFYLPGSAGSVIIMSMIGGYPVGARGCISLLEQGAITQKQAHRMLYFCVNAGPAFIISVVGGTLLQNALIGLLLFFSQIAAMLVIGITLGIIARFKKEPCHTVISSERSSQSPLVESTLDASKGLMNMSAFVILFSAFLSLLHATEIAQGLCQLLLRLHIPTPMAASIVSLLTEITNGCADTASLNAPIALIAFGLGFGGFCVHFQIFAVYLKMWNFQIEIYCIPVHPRNHSRTGNHVISSSVSTACSLCFSKYFRTTIRHDFLFMACWNFVGSLLCHFLIFCRIGTQKIERGRVAKNNKQ